MAKATARVGNTEELDRMKRIRCGLDLYISGSGASSTDWEGSPCHDTYATRTIFGLSDQDRRRKARVTLFLCTA